MGSEIDVLKRRLERERFGRKEAERLLEEKSREIYNINQELSQVALFAELSPHPVLRFNAQGKLLRANGSAEAFLGTAVATGNDLHVIFSSAPEIDFQSIIRESEIYQFTEQVGELFFQFVIKGVSQHGFANVYATDITVQELGKKEIEKSHRETQEILAAISSILIGIDRVGCITRWNWKAEQLLGLKREETIGKPMEACGIPWHLQEPGSYFEADQENVSLDEVLYKEPSGRDSLLNVHLNVIKDNDGQFNGYLILARDITERRALEQQLMQAQKLESLGQLAAGIAHEINTPIQYIGDNNRFLEVAFQRLRKVIEQSQQLLNRVKNGEGVIVDAISGVEEAIKKAKLDYMLQEIPCAIEEAIGGVNQVATIVAAMKQFSHPGAKEKSLANINEALRNTINVARNEWKYVAELETDFDADLPMVPCLVSELNQVFLNMIVNAAHAIEEMSNQQASFKGRITIRSRHDDSHAIIEIADNGAGVPKHVVSKIFDPFFTTKEVGKGSGQGLAIAFNVVHEKHDGTIDVKTTPGEGATFIICLPLALETEEVLA